MLRELEMVSENCIVPHEIANTKPSQRLMHQPGGVRTAGHLNQ